MKLKKHAFLLILGLFAASLFAQENQENQEDNGQLLSVESEEVDSDAYEEVISTETKKKNSLSESFSNFFKLGNQTFTEHDTLEFSVLTPLGTLKKEEAVFVSINDTDLAGFGSPYAAGYDYVFFDEADRKRFIDAGNQYLKDFENKKLERKSKKTNRKYGKFTSDVYFGSIKVQAKNQSQPITYLGYTFKKDSPYFMISCLTAPNMRYKNKDDPYPAESSAISYYFTKSQLKNLMNLLSEENLKSYKTNTLMNSYLTEEDAY